MVNPMSIAPSQELLFSLSQTVGWLLGFPDYDITYLKNIWDSYYYRLWYYRLLTYYVTCSLNDVAM